MEQAETEALIGELELRIDRLRSLYDQYFSGLEKLEPLVPRKDVERRLDTLRRQQIRNTGLRFRFQTLVQRFNTYQTHWQRICRQIETGTYKRDVLRAKARFGSLVPGQAETARGRNGDTQRAPAPDVDMGQDLDPENAWTGAGLDDLDASLNDAFHNTPGSSRRGEPVLRAEAPRGWAPLRAPALPEDDFEIGKPPSSLDPIPSSLLREAGLETTSSMAPPAPTSVRAPTTRSIAPRPTFGSLPPLGAAPPAPNAAARATTQMTGKKIVIQRTVPPAPPSAPSRVPPPLPSASARSVAPPAPAAPSVPPPLPVARSLPPPAPLAATLRGVPVPILRKVPSLQPPAAPSIPPARPAAPRAPSPPPEARVEEGGLPPQRVREIYGKYVETRRAHGESTANITIDGLARTLRETSSKVREKVGSDRPVDFEVQVKDGKTVLKPILK